MNNDTTAHHMHQMQLCYNTCTQNRVNYPRCKYSNTKNNKHVKCTQSKVMSMRNINLINLQNLKENEQNNRKRKDNNNKWKNRRPNGIEICMMAENTYEETMIEDGMNIWVADTAATCHMGCIQIGIRDERPSNTCIKVGNGEKIHGNTKGDINVTYTGLMDGIKHNVRLTNYMQSPGMKYNLYGIPYAIQNGAKVSP